MYIVTFYSFKGGVGRTMALANVAAQLACNGKRVLAIDFDLEAPGLDRYQPFSSILPTKGLVDYITNYRESGHSPIVDDYIYECEAKGNQIWILPAGGRSDSAYSEKLNSIDWLDLYENQDGYLMFEDMKLQLSSYNDVGFDYLLIDSRTGHTDVGGICTRQLPDSVVMLYLPTEQNVSGLAPVVDEISKENAIRRKMDASPIIIHYCISNTPNLDDEHGILSQRIKSSDKILGISEDVRGMIHHYDSLDLLDHENFSLTRPGTRLSKEYSDLTKRIISSNIQDIDGAIQSLDEIERSIFNSNRGNGTRSQADFSEAVSAILKAHPYDGRIAYLASRSFQQLGERAEELNALSSAIERGYKVSSSKARRAILLYAEGRGSEARKDLEDVLDSESSSGTDIVRSLSLLSVIDERKLLPKLRDLIDSGRLDLQGIISVSDFAMRYPEALSTIGHAIRERSRGLEKEELYRAKNIETLCFIGSGEFSLAVESIEACRVNGGDLDSLADMFNYAMANWGKKGAPDAAQMNIVIAKSDRTGIIKDTNYFQCIALAYWVLGDYESAVENLNSALNFIDTSGYHFSCWRYYYISAVEMRRDIEVMTENIKSKNSPRPDFVRLM